ncbi:hypothetical protein Ancab_002644 [Ancistrocladus abbreviatus]
MVGWLGLGKLWKGVVLSPITADAVDASGLFLQVCALFPLLANSLAAVFGAGVFQRWQLGRGCFLQLAACSLAVGMFTLQLVGCAGRVLAAQLRC